MRKANAVMGALGLAGMLCSIGYACTVSSPGLAAVFAVAAVLGLAGFVVNTAEALTGEE